MVFRVTFTDLTKQTPSYASNYDTLFDALTVAKNTEISNSRISYKALSDEQFDNCLFELLTAGYTHCGPKTHEFPRGTIVIYLTKVAGNNAKPVYVDELSKLLSLNSMRQANGPFIVEYMTSSSKKKTISFQHKVDAIGFVESCGVANTYMVTEYNFTYDKEEVSN